LVKLQPPTPARELPARTPVPSRPSCNHRFRGSKPRLTPRSAVGFFGSGGCAGRPARTDHSAYFGAATICCRPFLPSTRATLPEHEKMSTPEVGANASYFRVKTFLRKHKNSAGFPIAGCGNSTPVHTFFTETPHRRCRNLAGGVSLKSCSFILGGARFQACSRGEPLLNELSSCAEATRFW
jgi:hypothetical protein